MNIPEIEKLKDENFLLFLLDIFFLVLPGIAAIFVFKNELFLSLDWIKLVLLSASIMVPICYLNTLAISILDKTIPEDKRDFFFLLSKSIIVTGLLFYPLIIVGDANGWTFDSFLKVVVSAEFILLVAAERVDTRKNKKLKQK